MTGIGPLVLPPAAIGRGLNRVMVGTGALLTIAVGIVYSRHVLATWLRARAGAPNP
jgi:hypothetical protein